MRPNYRNDDCPNRTSHSPCGESSMSKRPVIRLAMQTQEAVPGELPRCWMMAQPYGAVPRSLGAMPWLIPLLPDDESRPRAIYERLDGLFLTGGVGVDPG